MFAGLFSCSPCENDERVLIIIVQCSQQEMSEDLLFRAVVYKIEYRESLGYKKS